MTAFLPNFLESTHRSHGILACKMYWDHRNFSSFSTKHPTILRTLTLMRIIIYCWHICKKRNLNYLAWKYAHSYKFHLNFRIGILFPFRNIAVLICRLITFCTLRHFGWQRHTHTLRSHMRWYLETFCNWGQIPPRKIIIIPFCRQSEQTNEKSL